MCSAIGLNALWLNANLIASSEIRTARKHHAFISANTIANLVTQINTRHMRLLVLPFPHKPPAATMQA